MKTQLIFIIFLTASMLACEQDQKGILSSIEAPVIARFETEVSEDSIVQFNNLSVNAESYLWDFGDGNTSFEENPLHTFTNGYYTVSLTAQNAQASNTFIQSIDVVTQIIDFTPPAVDTFQLIQTRWEYLTGGEGQSKTWVLANQLDAISFGPKEDINTKWWGMTQSDLNDRTCLLDNEYTFSYDSVYQRDVKGSIWKEYNVFAETGCMAEGNFLQTNKSTDVEAWGSGTFDYKLSLSGDSILINTSGAGAYIGHYVMGIDDSSWEPGMEYTYLITSISADTVQIQSYGFAGDSPLDGYDETEADRYWKATLVSK